MADKDEDLAILKRKIILVDKLVRNKQKTDTKIKELTAALEKKDKELAEVQSRISITGMPTLDEAEKTNVEDTKKLKEEIQMLKARLLEKTTSETKYRQESMSRSQKIGQLEIEDGKKTNKIKQLEQEIGLKNKEIIKRELDNQEMQRKVDDVENARKILMKEMESGKHAEAMKKVYEEEKWKNKAEISRLSQERAAYEQKIQNLETLVKCHTVKNNELQKSADIESKAIEENKAFEKIIDKKDKMIATLEKKLQKAYERMNQTPKSKSKKPPLNSSQNSSMEMDVDEPIFIDTDKDISEDELEVTAVVPSRKRLSFLNAASKGRFSVFNSPMKSSKTSRRRVAIFRKVGQLDCVLCFLPSPLPHLPCLSDSALQSSVQSQAQSLPNKATKRSLSESSSPRKKAKLSHLPEPCHPPSPNQRPPPHPIPFLPVSSTPIDNVKKPTKPGRPSKNKTLKKAKKLMIANHQLPHLPTSSRPASPLSESLDDSDLHPPSKSRTAHVKIQPQSSNIQATKSLPYHPTILSQSTVKKTVKAINMMTTPSSIPSSRSMATPGSARDRIYQAGLGPQAVELNPVKGLCKLNPSQLEAAKRRANVGAQSFVPSKDGFRVSKHEHKTGAKVSAEGDKPTKDTKTENTNKTNVEEDFFCPSRVTTNPSALAKPTSSIEGDTSISSNMKSDEDFFCPSRVNTHPSAPAKQTSSNESDASISSKSLTKKLPTAEVKTDPDNDKMETETVIKEIDIASKAVSANASRTTSIESLDDDLNLSDDDSDDDNLTIETNNIKPEDTVKKSDVEPDEYAEITNGSCDTTEVEKKESPDISPDKKKSDFLETFLLVPRTEPLLSPVKRKSNSEFAMAGGSKINSIALGLTSSSSVVNVKSETSLSNSSSVSQTSNILNSSSNICQSTKDPSNISITNAPSSSKGPAKPKKFANFLEELIDGFKIRNEEDQKKLKAEKTRLWEERKSFAYEAHLEKLRKHVKNLMGDQNELSYNHLVEAIAGTHIPGSDSMLCDLVYEHLTSEHKETPLLNATSDDQPCITRKQQRMFTLLVSLQSRPGYERVMERMLSLIRHSMFSRDRMYHIKVNAIQNFGRMFVLCARYADDVEAMNHFLYDLFYFKSPRNHILVGVMMALWPDVFPVFGSPLASTPLVQTLVWCIFNTGPAHKAPEMRVPETQADFTQMYGFKPHDLKAEKLVPAFIQLAEDNTEDAALLVEVSKCLLLLGRCKEYLWVNNNIVMRLFKVLSKSMDSNYRRSNSQTPMRWVFTTLGLLSRVYIAEGRSNLDSLLTQMTEFLTSTGDTIQAETEQCCIRAIVYLGYHLQSQVAMFLKKWKPVHALDPKTRCLLEDFVGTRGKKHSNITAHVAKLEMLRSRKNRGINRFRKS